MRCSICGSKKIKAETLTHRFTESGLDNVVLKGVKRYHCKDCGETVYDFGPLEALHQVIAILLLRKSGLLTGKEIRFLRASIGLSGKDFAEKIGYNPQAWSKIENDKVKVDKKVDRLVRLSVTNAKPEYDYHLLDGESEEKQSDTIKLRYHKNTWEPMAQSCH